MSESTIEWTEQTWNPVTGCDRISPGCDHCYAMTLAKRLKGMGQPKYQRDGDPRTSGPGFGLTVHEDALSVPKRRKKPTMYFVNSMSDLFHKDVPVDFIAAVFGVMAQCPQHTFQVLTKRPKRMRNVLTEMSEWTGVESGAWGEWPLRNVWLGTSIESRDYVWRADLLRETPAAVRFISAEPLLGPLVGHTDGIFGEGRPQRCRGCQAVGPVNWWPRAEPLDEPHAKDLWQPRCRECQSALLLDSIDWLIVGGESGPGHRPVRLDWIRDLRDACAPTSPLMPPTTAFFFKQWGGDRPKANGRELDCRTWDEMPGVETDMVA